MVKLTAAVAARLGATQVHMTYAYEGPADTRRDEYLRRTADELAKGARSLTVSQSHHDVGPAKPVRSFEQILDLAKQQSCDLIVTAAPYLDDYNQLGSASTGTNLDMLLRGRHIPLLVIREPYEKIDQCLEHLVVPLSFLGEHGSLALSWGLKLLSEASGKLHLLAIVDTEAIEAVGSVAGDAVDLEEIDERKLAGLVKPDIAGLVAAAQRSAAEANVGCRVSVRTGQPVEQVLAFAREQERSLLVTGCPEDCSATGYLRVQALIRESPDPVLVV